nr:putative salivary protein [Nilaparvata lugens]
MILLNFDTALLIATLVLISAQLCSAGRFDFSNFSSDKQTITDEDINRLSADMDKNFNNLFNGEGEKNAILEVLSDIMEVENPISEVTFGGYNVESSFNKKLAYGRALLRQQMEAVHQARRTK